PSRPAAAVTASASSTTPAPAGGHTPASSSERGAHVSVTVLEPDGEALGPAPVLALPLRLDGDRLATLQQGSAAELGQSVRLLMATRPGERLESPAYGTRDYTFANVTDVDAEEIRAAVREHEPRVTA